VVNAAEFNLNLAGKKDRIRDCKLHPQITEKMRQENAMKPSEDRQENAMKPSEDIK